MPNKLIVESQRDMLEVLGFERDHGCQCLSAIGQQEQFSSDKQLIGKFQGWMQTAQRTCMMAAGKGGGKGNMCSQQPNEHQMQVAKELQDVMPEAKKQVESMTPDERGSFLTN